MYQKCVWTFCWEIWKLLQGIMDITFSTWKCSLWFNGSQQVCEIPIHTLDPLKASTETSSGEVGIQYSKWQKFPDIFCGVFPVFPTLLLRTGWFLPWSLLLKVQMRSSSDLRFAPDDLRRSVYLFCLDIWPLRFLFRLYVGIEWVSICSPGLPSLNCDGPLLMSPCEKVHLMWSALCRFLCRS